MLTKAIMLAVMQIESAGNPNALSHANAKGLYQLTPIGEREVCQQFGCEKDYNIWDPSTNVRMGYQLLTFYLSEANNDVIGMIVMYSSGYVGYRKYLLGEPLSQETQAYVIKFKQLRRYYETIYSRIPSDVPQHYDLVDHVTGDDNLFDVGLLFGQASN